jgi:hypothetical protein
MDGRDPILKARVPIKGVKLAASRIAQAPSRHCRRQWCPRRGQSSGRLHRQRVLLLFALGSSVAPPVAYCSGQAASSPESELPRPPPGSPCRARTSACSPSQWALVAPPLGHTEALCVAHCSTEHFPSPDFAPSRCAVPVLPLPLAGDRSGRATTANHSVVSSIAVQCRLSARSGDPSPVASTPAPPGLLCCKFFLAGFFVLKARVVL